MLDNSVDVDNLVPRALFSGFRGLTSKAREKRHGNEALMWTLVLLASILKPRLLLLILQMMLVFETTLCLYLQRFYSISSSPEVHPNEIHVTAMVFECHKRGKLETSLI